MARLDVDLVELDVRRCRDGVLVVRHDPEVEVAGRRVAVGALTAAELARHAGPQVLLDDALAVLRGRRGVHLDLKDVGGEAVLVAHVVAVMGADAVLVTAVAEESVRRVREWAREHHPGLPVGLSLGGADLSARHPLRAAATVLGDLVPGRRLRRCDATLVAAEKTLARLRAARAAERRGLPLLVWTVDRPRELRRWLADPRAWLVVTNHPGRALRLRSATARPAAQTRN